MINEKMIRKMKQTNISTDKEKTKTRVEELWKAATKSQKQLVQDIAGISRATIYRVYNTGSISAKMVAPMAQTFNVNPDYLTAKTDIKGECTDEILASFLTELGYSKVLADAAKGRRRVPKAAEADYEEPTTAVDEAVCNDTCCDMCNIDLNLSDIYLLVQALLLKEKSGSADATAKVAKLKALLLS